MVAELQVSTRRLTAGQRRRQLVAVALELFAQRGYRATTMDDIAEAAGVTKPLVYQHFSSKRALYLELVNSIAQELLIAVKTAVSQARGPRQQVEMGFAAYFRLVISREAEFRLLYGRDHADDKELGLALRTVEDAIAAAIEPLIDAGLDDDHRRLLAYAVVGMAEGASRRFMEQRTVGGGGAVEEEVARLAQRMADLAWAGLRSVHAD
jgi:AcrR family transcriptional regulator